MSLAMAGLRVEEIPSFSKLDQPIIVSVEAAIGCGKSTFVDLATKHFGHAIVTVQEPVEEWIKVNGKDGCNILETFYSAMERWSFSFQHYVLITQVNVLEEAVKTLRQEGRLQNTIIFMERSHTAAKPLFGELLNEAGNMTGEEWGMYTEWYDYALDHAPKVCGHVYLKAREETMTARIQARQRGEESGSVDPEYTQKLIAKHEKFMHAQRTKGIPVLELDAEPDFRKEGEEQKKVMDALATFFDELRVKYLCEQPVGAEEPLIASSG